MAVNARVLADLIHESEVFESLVAELPPEDWDRPTLAPGWAIRHHVAHMLFAFRIAAFAVLHPLEFGVPAEGQVTSAMDVALGEDVTDPPELLLSRYRAERDLAVKALASVRDGQLVPWLDGPCSPGTIAATGMLELFAHGQDIADALKACLVRTDRLHPAVALAVAHRDFAYPVRNLVAPADPFRFALRAPSGALWTFGPPDAEDRVTGTAEDFLQLVTRRRHRWDLGLHARGSEADRWLDIAQAYPGLPGPPRPPSRRVG